MQICSLSLYNFRNYTKEKIEFNKRWNIIIGHNGAGKTNILEAIYFLATSKSPRTINISNLINFGKKEASIEAYVKGNTQEGLLKQKITDSKKKQLFNDLEKKADKIIPFVYFVPEDLNIIKGEASLRRKALNFILIQVYPTYKEVLQRYRRIVLERNACLRRIREKIEPVEYLENWNEPLIECSLKILEKRKKIIDSLNIFVQDISDTMFDDKKLKIEYKYFLHTKYKIEEINKETLRESLENIKEKEIELGISLIGPHRDDIDFVLNKKSLKTFGSQGQQRAGILLFKIATSKVLEEFLEECPIILFDDVFSELDSKRKQGLEKILNNETQIFLTSTSIDGFEIPEDATVFEIVNGKIEQKEILNSIQI